MLFWWLSPTLSLPWQSLRRIAPISHNNRCAACAIYVGSQKSESGASLVRLSSSVTEPLVKFRRFLNPVDADVNEFLKDFGISNMLLQVHPSMLRSDLLPNNSSVRFHHRISFRKHRKQIIFFLFSSNILTLVNCLMSTVISRIRSLFHSPVWAISYCDDFLTSANAGNECEVSRPMDNNGSSTMKILWEWEMNQFLGEWIFQMKIDFSKKFLALQKLAKVWIEATHVSAEVCGACLTNIKSRYWFAWLKKNPISRADFDWSLWYNER